MSCRRRPRGCSRFCRCCRPAATGRVRSWPGGWASARVRSAVTSTVCVSSVIRSRLSRGPTADISWRPVRGCPRCCSTTIRPSPWPWRFRRSPRRAPAVGEAAARALNTVRQVMPARLRHRIDTFQVTAVERPATRPDVRVDGSVLVALSAAVHAGEVLRFDYAAAFSPQAGDGGVCGAAAPGGAASSGHLGWALVSGRLGSRPGGLAHLPCRPDGAALPHGAAFRVARGARR